ncbi:MAG: DUF481 domain-containing protein [Gammaproteobacteria bacterium]|jgi:putative salt-induced outer membrane protein YdiY
MHFTFKKDFNYKVIPAFLMLLVLSTQAQAIVSMESVHLGEPPQGFTGAFDLSIDAEYGNTEEIDVSTGLKLQLAKDKNVDFVLMSYSYGETSDVRDENESFLHLRHIHQRDTRFAWEAFSQLSSDEFTSLKLRGLVGGGVRLTLGEITDQRAFYLGVGGFYERERLDIDATSNVDETSNTVRGNIYFVVKHQFNKQVSLVSSTYYQPALDEFSDFRANEDASLVSSLTDDLSFKVGIKIEHDSDPPPDVDKTDTTIHVGVSLAF